MEISSGRIDTVYGERRHFEAPNWAPDGRYFIVNSEGLLYRLPANGGGGLEEIPTDNRFRARSKAESRRSC